jgi:hypothetical protein
MPLRVIVTPVKPAGILLFDSPFNLSVLSTVDGFFPITIHPKIYHRYWNSDGKAVSKFIGQCLTMHGISKPNIFHIFGILTNCVPFRIEPTSIVDCDK